MEQSCVIAGWGLLKFLQAAELKIPKSGGVSDDVADLELKKSDFREFWGDAPPP